MPELTEFDRDRVADDIAQLTEMIERKQWLWEAEQDTDRKAQLSQELAQHEQELLTAKALLA